MANNANTTKKAEPAVQAAPAAPKPAKPEKKKAIPDSTLINVKSNVFGSLYYIDKQTNETVEWENSGDVVQIPMAMLRHMKINASKFFSHQIVIIEGFVDEDEMAGYTAEDIYRELMISQYYNDLFDLTDATHLLTKSEDDVRKLLKVMGNAGRTKLIVALKEYYKAGMIDSMKQIRMFEKVLDFKMSEEEEE